MTLAPPRDPSVRPAGVLLAADETKEGEKRTVTELRVDEVGPALRYATAKVNKVGRGSGGSAPAADPWAGAPVPAGVGAGTGDEPPF